MFPCLGIRELKTANSVLSDGDIHDLDILLRFLPLEYPRVLNLVHYIHALIDSSKDCVLPIKPRRLFRGDEELGAIRVWSRVGHAQHIRLVVLQI